LSATAAKVSLAFSNQNEWSIATALLNCGLHRAHRDGEITLRSPGSPVVLVSATADCRECADTAVTEVNKDDRSCRAYALPSRFLISDSDL